MAQVTIIRARALSGARLEGDSQFTFDAVLRESSSDTGELTEYPVEDGADRADHFRLKPVEVSLTAMLTNTPLHESATQGRERRLHESLLALFRTGEPMTLVTAVRTYHNMVILGVSTPRQGPQQALVVEIELRQLLTSITETVQLPRRGGRRNAGHQAASEASAAAEVGVATAASTPIDEQLEAQEQARAQGQDATATAGAAASGGA